MPSEKIKVAVLDDYQKVAESCAEWDTLGCEVTFVDEHLESSSAVIVALKGIDIVVAMRERTPFDATVLEKLPDLKLLITTGMRNVSIDVAAAKERGVVVCGTRSPGHATAELAFALIQTLARGLTGEAASVRSGGWQKGLGRDLRGATLGLIGLGRLGSQVAQFAMAFGMDIIAWSENLTTDRVEEVGVRAVSRSELFELSDFISIHLRLSDRTRGLVSASELEMMKDDAYLINTSRGEIVDEEALLSAVRSGAIAGAALDVFGEEPLSGDHPFRHAPTILATPHIGYVTRETYEVFYGDAVEGIAAWIAGSPVRVLEP